MADRKAALVEKLETNGQETAAWFADLPPDAYHRMVYTDEVQWSVRRILAHLITIEKTMHWLFRDILSGGPGSPEDFDVSRFNSTQPQKLDDVPMEELIRRFLQVREETVDIVRTMSDSDLDREGRHAFHGQGRLERFIHWAYEHVDLHLGDTRRALDGVNA